MPEARPLRLENDLALQTQGARLIEQQSSASSSVVLIITREGMEHMATLLKQLYSRTLHNNFSTPTHPDRHLIYVQMVQLLRHSIPLKSQNGLGQEPFETCMSAEIEEKTPTLTRAILTEEVSAQMGLTRIESEQFIESRFSSVVNSLARGEEVKISSSRITL